jgi:hypothetical protein
MKDALIALLYLSLSLIRLLVSPFACILAIAARSVMLKEDKVLWRDSGVVKAGVIQDSPVNNMSYYFQVSFGPCGYATVKWVNKNQLWPDNAFNRFVLGYIS